jgi:hypothetical protein
MRVNKTYVERVPRLKNEYEYQHQKSEETQVQVKK